MDRGVFEVHSTKLCKREQGHWCAGGGGRGRGWVEMGIMGGLQVGRRRADVGERCDVGGSDTVDWG